MANEKYDGNSLIGKYISACHQSNQPLTGEQIGLLEKTINESFGIKKNKSPPIDLVKPLDKEILSRAAFAGHSGTGRIMNVLRGYRKNNNTMSDELPITEAEAWSLYSLTLEEVWRNPVTIGYKELKKKYGIPKTYGGASFHVLMSYFEIKGIIGEDGFPLPIEDSDPLPK